MRDDDKPSDPMAQDRFARLLTGVVPTAAADRSAPNQIPHDRRPADRALDDHVPDRAQDRAVAALVALSPGRRAMKPLIAVAVCVALAASFIAWRSRPAVSPVAAVPSPAAAGGAFTSPAVLPASAAPVPSASAAGLVVAVQGRVKHPGLVRLPPGSRIADAIDAAGGVLPGTDISYVNLAQKVADGQLIVIGKSGPAGGSVGAASGASAGSSGGGGAGVAPGQPIDLNTASATDLDSLPGIGPALAARIVDYRTQHGGFHTVDELRNVSGIGDAKFAEIKDLVTV